MIFTGDIAIPFPNAIKIVNFPEEFFEKKWFSNLEGALINDRDFQKAKSVVFNDMEGIKELAKRFNFCGFALANNHIFDTGNFEQTIAFLRENNLPFCGIGKNIQEASKPLVLDNSGCKVVILNFGWKVIQCEVTCGDYIGVNPLTKKHVFKILKECIQNFPGAKIIPFMHWGYELEAEPQPFERELAHRLIDEGAAGVIGCHSHRISGFEIYKDKPIVYGLGNWMFTQNYYNNGKLKFPDFCNEELIFEWDFENDTFKLHFFSYDRISSELKYMRTENIINDVTIQEYTPFNKFSNNAYKKWYKKNHYHKRKGLPIYYWNDTHLEVIIKNNINFLRDKVLNFYLKHK